MSKERAKLDRTRSFGEVYGPGAVRFEQDHKEFDGAGLEIVGNKSTRVVAATNADEPGPVAGSAETQPVGDGNPVPNTANGTENRPPGDMNIEDKDPQDTTMRELRERYTKITGGKKTKAMNKAKVQQQIRDELAA